VTSARIVTCPERRELPGCLAHCHEYDPDKVSVHSRDGEGDALTLLAYTDDEKLPRFGVPGDVGRSDPHLVNAICDLTGFNYGVHRPFPHHVQVQGYSPLPEQGSFPLCVVEFIIPSMHRDRLPTLYRVLSDSMERVPLNFTLQISGNFRTLTCPPQLCLYCHSHHSGLSCHHRLADQLLYLAYFHGDTAVRIIHGPGVHHRPASGHCILPLDKYLVPLPYLRVSASDTWGKDVSLRHKPVYRDTVYPGDKGPSGKGRSEEPGTRVDQRRVVTPPSQRSAQGSARGPGARA